MLFEDPQFRKFLLFADFERPDHDKLSFQIPENERDYVRIYQENIRPIIREAKQQNSHPSLNKSDQAVVRPSGSLV